MLRVTAKSRFVNSSGAANSSTTESRIVNHECTGKKARPTAEHTREFYVTSIRELGRNFQQVYYQLANS